MARSQLGANNQVFVEYFRAYNEVSTNVAPTPLTGLSMLPTSPYLPGQRHHADHDAGINTATPISVGWRMEPAGQRQNESTTRPIASCSAWTAKARAGRTTRPRYYSGSRARATSSPTATSVATKIVDGLNGLNGAPFLNPFGPQTAAGHELHFSSKVLGEVQSIDGDIWGINLNGQTTIFNTNAGDWILAVGGEYRKEEVNYTNNFTLIRQAASSGLELAEDAKGDRNVYALLAELNIPVLKTMEFNVALRYDDYSDVGSNVSPKISWRWQAMDNLLLRASYNQGFRAPSLYDIYAPNSITFTGDNYDDPVLCPNGVPAPNADPARDCGQQFQSQGGGNKALEPETSDAWSLGLVFDITKNVSASVDYWNTKINDTVGFVPEGSIFGDPAKYANLYVRCSQLSPADRAKLVATCVGADTDPALAYIVQTQQNLGSIKAQGLDFSFLAREANEYGNFTLSLQGTYLLDWKQQLEPGGPYYNALGVYSRELDFPAIRWKHVIMAGWQMGPWGVNLFNRLQSSYWDQNTTEFGDPYDDNTVGAFSTWDLTGTWQGVKGLTVTAGVLNLFDEKASFSNQGLTFQVGYDPRFTNPLGRQFFLRAGYEFK